MKKCLRKKCQKEFEPNKPKQVFCSAKCRVYFSREEKEQVPYSEVKDLNNQTNKIEPKKPLGNSKSNYTVNTLPKKDVTLNNEPAEGTNRFFLKYGAFTFDELKNKK